MQLGKLPISSGTKPEVPYQCVNTQETTPEAMRQATEINVSINYTVKMPLFVGYMITYIEDSRGFSHKLFQWKEFSKYARCNSHTPMSVPFYGLVIPLEKQQEKISHLYWQQN